MSANTPSRVGALLPHEPVARRSMLLLGGLGLTGAWGLRAASTELAHARPRQESPAADLGLPTPVAAPAPGTQAREPFSSGGIGRWQTSSHQASTPDEDRAAARGDGIHLLGDSIGSRLLPALKHRAGSRPVSYDVWNGRPTAPALESLAHAVDEDRLAPTVLIVLGSNDIFDPWHYEDAVRRARAIAGERRLLWVTPYVSRPSAPSADLRNSTLLGLVLERAVAAGTIELVRWFEFLARSGDAIPDLIEDGVHPSPAGASALAGLVITCLG